MKKCSLQEMILMRCVCMGLSENPDSMSYFHISDTRGQNERKNAVEQ